MLDPGTSGPAFENLPLRPKGVHYQIADTGSVTSRFLSSIFQPITTFFPSLNQDPAPPPPPPPLSVATPPSSTAALAALESGILQGERSLRWILAEHETLKRNMPYLQLSSRPVVSLFRRLLAVGSYRQFLEFVEREDLVAVEGVGLLKLSLEEFDEARRKDVLQELRQMCEREHRIRFRGMLAELELQAEKDLHSAVMRETAMMLSQLMGESAKATEDGFAKGVAVAKDLTMLCAIVDKIIATRTRIGVETSRVIFERFVELDGLTESIEYVLNPAINVPESNNIGRICNAFCELGRYKEGYALITAALKVNKFGFVSDRDVLVGIRAVDSSGGKTEVELVGLWEALNTSKAISIRDITKHTFAAFIGRACRLKFGKKSQWWEGGGATPLLKMCMEIIILRLQGEVKTEHLSTLVEAWVWNWQGNEEARVNTNSLSQSIPFLSNFLGVLSPDQFDDVLKQAITRIMANCQRMDNEIWPVRVLWPFVASIAHNRKLWTNEESIALWTLEGAVLRKGLAPKYLAFRTDEEIARFVVRHYLPFRIALESEDASVKEKAKAVFYQLRGLERRRADLDPDVRAEIEAGMDRAIDTRIGPFATAILAFKGTGIPCRTLLLDMVYTLYRLGRPADIVEMLRSLSPHTIRPSSSQYALLVRTLAPEYPHSALALLKLFAKSQYSTFASYIAMVAHKHPHLALSAYRFLTRPNVFPFTPDQPQLAPRRRPKRRLLVAMAWKFANSPALTARQCHRWVIQCYRTTLKLGYSPGPTMGLALAVSSVQRTIREGVPVRLNSARQKWVAKVVRRQCGTARAKQLQEILARYEVRRSEHRKNRSPRW